MNDEKSDLNTTSKEPYPKQDEVTGNALVSVGVFSVLAFFLGVFGAHDFAVGWKRQGWWHIATLVAAAIAVRFISISSFLPPTLVFGGWLWAIVEMIDYRKKYSSLDPSVLRRRDCLAITVTAEVLSSVAIILDVVFIRLIALAKSCYGSGCSGAGWGIVLMVWISILPVILMIAFNISAFSCYKKLSEWEKKDKAVIVNRTIAKCLCILWVILTILVFITGFWQ